MAVLIKTLTLSLSDAAGVVQQVECQLDEATLRDTPTTEDIVVFCGTETTATPKYELVIGGFQDWSSVNAVTDLLHLAYIDLVDNPTVVGSGEIDFVLQVGQATRTGIAKPISDVPFGGTAGSPLKFSTTLSVPTRPTDAVIP